MSLTLFHIYVTSFNLSFLVGVACMFVLVDLLAYNFLQQITCRINEEHNRPRLILSQESKRLPMDLLTFSRTCWLITAPIVAYGRHMLVMSETDFKWIRCITCTTFREERSQINVILQRKLLAVTLSVVCNVYKHQLYVHGDLWLHLWLKNHWKNTGYYSIFQLLLSLFVFLFFVFQLLLLLLLND